MKTKRKKTKLNKYQKLLIIVILIYTTVSFINLGNIKSPKTFVNLKNNEYAIYEIEDGSIPSEMVYFVGNDNAYVSTFLATDYDIFTNEGFEYDASFGTDFGAVYTWRRESINKDKKNSRYIMLASYWDSTVLGEVAFLDEEGAIIQTRLISGTDLLNDEADTIQLKRTFMNSAYFDEIYFERASYEIFNNKYIFECTHPPLGKIIMWIPMAIFGISPFTARLMGNIAGILMILVMYYIAKELFKDEKYALFASIILALDGMHFAQTRIATVDSFLVLFSMVSILFFIKYLKSKNKYKYHLLAISGFMWGCAVSTKWIAFFLGLGLAIIFFIDYFVNKKIIINKKFNYKPILMGFLCFVILPLTIYTLSYLPVAMNQNETVIYKSVNKNGISKEEMIRPNSIRGLFLYQISMYQFHSRVGTAEDYQVHPYSSKWYTWPVLYKPTWLSVDFYDNNMKSTIASMGNPIIWWLSDISFILMLFYSIKKKDKIGLLLFILIISTWLPFIFISREMYIYHYFLTSILMMLTIVFVVSKILKYKPKLKYLIPTLVTIFLISFIYFYPVCGGMIVSEDYINSTKWLSSWVY